MALHPASPHPRFQPRSRADWRRWLARHHEDGRGVWLVFLKGERRQITYDAAVEEALCFGWIDSIMRSIDAGRYMQLFTPRKPKSQWSAPNKSRIRKLEAAGLMTAAGLAAIAVAKKNGSWTVIDSVGALEVPLDFARALDANPAARAKFDAFSKTAKKSFLYWINSAKRDETRARRVKESVALIAKGAKGPR